MATQVIVRPYICADGRNGLPRTTARSLRLSVFARDIDSMPEEPRAKPQRRQVSGLLRELLVTDLEIRSHQNGSRRRQGS